MPLSCPADREMIVFEGFHSPPLPRTSPPAQRSEVGGVGRRPGEGPPRVALSAAPITLAPLRSPSPSRSCFARSTSPSFAGGGGFYNLPSRAAQRSGRGRPSGRGRARRVLHTTPSQQHPHPAVHLPLPISLSLARPPPASPGEEVFITSPPAQRSEVGGVGRQAGGGLAACCTQRRPYNTVNPQFSQPPRQASIPAALIMRLYCPNIRILARHHLQYHAPATRLT